MTSFDINIQLAAGDLINMTRAGLLLTDETYQEVYNRYSIRKDQLSLVFGLVDLEFMRRVPGIDEMLYEGRLRKS